MVSPTPKDPSPHIIRNVSMMPHSPSTLSSARKSTIGQSMAKVKAFMERSGNETIKDLGSKISGDYEFHIFPQTGGGFLIEIGDQSAFISQSNPTTKEIASEVQKIWDNLFGASISGSTDVAKKPETSLPPLPSSPILSSGSSPVSIPNPPSSELIDVISETTQEHAAAINYYYNVIAKNHQAGPFPPIHKHLLSLLGEGKKVLNDDSLSLPAFMPDDLNLLFSSDQKLYDTTSLDLFLLDDIQKQTGIGCFKQAAVSYTLLSPAIKSKLQDRLSLPFINKTFPDCTDESINQIAQGLKKQNTDLLQRDLEALKGSIRFDTLKRLNTLRATKTATAHTQAISRLTKTTEQLSATNAELEQGLDAYQAYADELSSQLETLTKTLQEKHDLATSLAYELEQSRAAYSQLHLRSSARITYLESQLSAAKKEKGKAEAKAVELETRNSSLTTRMGTAEAALVTLGHQLEGAKSDLATSQRQEEALKVQIQALDDIINQKLASLETAETLISDASSLQDKMAVLIKAFEGKALSARQDIEALSHTLTALQSNYRRVEDEKNAALNTIEALNKTQSSLQETIQRTLKEKDSIQESMKTIDAARKAAEARVLELEKQLSLQATTIEELEASQRALNKDISYKEAELAQLHQQLQQAQSTLKTEAQAHKGALEDAQRKFTEAQAQLSVLETQNKTLKKEVSSIQAQLTSQSALIRDLETVKASLEALDEKQKGEIKALKTHFADIGTTYGITSRDPLIIKEEIGKKLTSLNTLETALKDKLSRLGQQLDHSEAARKEAEKEKDALSAQITALQEADTLQRAQIQAQVDQIEKLKTQATELSDSLKTMCTQNSALSSQLEAVQTKVQEKEALIATKDEALQKLQNSIGTVEAELSRNKESLEATTSAKNALEAKLREAIAKSASSDETLKKQATTISKLEEALSAQRTLVADIKSTYQASIEDLKTSLREQKNATIELQTSMADLLTLTRSRLEEAKLAFQAKNESLTAQLHALSLKNATLEKKAAKLTELEKALNPQSLTTPDAIEEHFKIFEQLKAHQQAFQKELESLGKTPDDIKKVFLEQERKLDSLKTDLKDQLAQIATKDETIANLQEQIAISQKNLAEISADYKKRITSLEQNKAEAEKSFAEERAKFAAALRVKDEDASRKIQDLSSQIQTELSKSDALEAENAALKARLARLEETATASFDATSSLQKEVSLLKKQSAEAKLLAFIEKRALKEKAQAFSLWRLQTLAQKKAKEKQELLKEVEERSKALEALATKHDVLISFLKSKLSRSETLDPSKSEEEELIRVFSARIEAQEKATSKASLDLEEASSTLSSQATLLASQETRIKELELALRSRDDRIGTLDAALEVIKEQKKALEASLKEEKTENRASILRLQAELEETTKTKQALQQELLASQQQLPIIQAQLDESIKAQAATQNSLEKLQRDYDVLQKHCVETTQQLAQAKSLLETLHRSYNQIQEETALRITKIQKENKEAYDRLAALLEEATTTIGEKEAEISQLRIELDAIRTSSAKELAAFTKDKTDSLESLRASHASLMIEKENEIEAKNQELTTLKTRYAALKQEQTETLGKLEEKQAALESAISTNTSLEKEKTGLTEEIARLKEEFKEQQAVLTALIADKKAHLEGLNSENLRLNELIKSLLSSFEIPAPDIDSAIKTIQTQTTTIKDLEKALAAKKLELTDLDASSRGEAEALKTEIKGLQDALEAANKAISTITIDNQEALSTLLSQLGSLAPTIPEIQSVLGTISTLEKPLTLSKIAAHLASLPPMIEEKFKTLKRSYTTSIDDLRLTLQAFKAEQAALQTSLDSSKKTIAALNARLEEQEAINQKQFTEALEHFKSTLTKLAEDKDATIKGLVDEIRQLRSQNKDASAKISELESLNKQLATQVEAALDTTLFIEKQNREKIEQLQTELTEKEGIQTKVQQQLAEIRAKEARITTIERELIASKAHSAEISAELVILRSESAKTIEELNGNFTLVQAQANALQVALDEAKAINAKLTDERAGLQRDLDATRATNTELIARGTVLQEALAKANKINAELTAGGAAALEAQKAAQEQLRASLEMVKILTEEALPKTAYGRFDALYSSHLASLMSSLKDHVDLNRRIQYALHCSSVSEEKLSESCKRAIITLSLPFADDKTHTTGTLDSIVRFEKASLDSFPELDKLMIDKDALTKIHKEYPVKKGTGLAEFYKTSTSDISKELLKASGKRPSGVGAAAAGAASGGSGTEDPYSLSTTLAPAVGLLLNPATGKGRFGVDNLFEIFMDKKAIITSLTENKEARKAALALEIAKYLAAVGSATHVSSSKERIINEHLLLSSEEELEAIKAFEGLSAKYSQDIIFVALNQRFSKDIAYFIDATDQEMINTITAFITHKHLDNLLTLIIKNHSIAKDLCVKRILVGTQLIGHAYKEKLELSRALKSGFNLLNQLYTAVFLRLP